MVDDQHEVRNQTGGEIRGAVVQAGTIHQVRLGETTAHGDAVEAGRGLVPRQLPPVVWDFTGRAEHVAALDALLPALPADRDEMAGDTVPPPHTAVITAIDGTAGIGKTTLAVWWAHRVQHRFPDGTLHVNLRGYGPGDPATPGEVLDGFLRALGTPAEVMPSGVEAQSALFRSLLAGRRMLLVLDNANSADQVRPLLPGTSGCVVVVTSRDSLTGLVVTEGARRLTLDLLTEPEARHLITSILGPARTTAEPDAVAELIRLCARLPLALRIAATRVAASPHTTVAEVAAELVDEGSRLEVLSRGGDERAAVRAVFDWSYQRLSGQQARLFRRLGLHPGPGLSVDAAAALAGLEPAQARQWLEELAGAHLITPTGGGRYRFHDLLRAYAVDQAHHHDPAADRDRALGALLDWCAHTAITCDTMLFPAFPRLPHQIETPAHPTVISDLESAWLWVMAEQGNLLAALRHSARHGRHSHTLALANGLRFLASLGRWEDRLEAVDAALVAASQSGDRSAEAFMHIGRAECFLDRQRWDQARTEYQRVETLASELGDQRWYAGAQFGLGRLSVLQGRFAEALPLLWKSLPVARGVDSGRLESVVEINLSMANIGLGDFQQALVHGQRGLMLCRQCGDHGGEAGTLHRIAQAWQGLGDYPQAIALCREAIALGRDTRVSPAGLVAEPLDTLAQCLHHAGHTGEALTCWQEAARIFDTYGRPEDATRVRERLQGS